MERKVQQMAMENVAINEENTRRIVKVERPSFDVDLALYQSYESRSIVSDSDAKIVTQCALEIKKAIDDMEKQRLKYTRPLDELKAEMIRDEREVTEPLKKILKLLNLKLLTWTESQEAIRREAAERKRKEDLAALEAEKERQFALAVQTNDTKAADAIIEIEKNAERLAAKPVEVFNTIRTATGSSGITTRWKHTVIDESLVPREFLMVDDAKLRKYATAKKESAKVPGVQFYPEKGMVHHG